ncbi:MAG: class I SAM-dependent methyltransferase [Planctomycetes bacterium]|nr:class I SAM-dependent methyltransferase [Planctomycetota bacterium]
MICSNSFYDFCLKALLHIHSRSYNWAGRLAAKLNNNLHPKKQIINYEKWFCDRLQTDSVVVDIGCSTGEMVRSLAEKVKMVYGLEIEEKRIQQANQSFQQDNVKFICADATSYDYSKLMPIDCITLSNVLEHIEHRVSFLKALQERVHWKQEEKKRFLIRVPTIEREWIAVYKKERGLEYRLDYSHFIEYTLQEFCEEMKSAGLTIKDISTRFGEIYCEAYA